MSTVALDFSRSQLLIDNKPLAQVVCGRPADYVFDGRPRCPPERMCTKDVPCELHKLERAQLEFNELRLTFLTTGRVERMAELAERLPRISRALRRAATGWRDTSGRVHRFAIDNPELDDDELGDTCEHGERGDCERCKADAAELDAL